MRSLFIILSLTFALPAAAAPRRGPAPAPEAPPAPTPKEFWEAPEVWLTDVQDPFGTRRASRGEVAPKTPGAPEPSYYRLWGLQPLQIQFLRAGETVMEVWVRPEGGSRQAMIRVTVRSDGRAFVQARAGVPCCSPAINKRVEVDAELPAGEDRRFTALAAHALWTQPKDVVIDDGSGALEPLCVGGNAYDLYLLQQGRFVHARRDCGGAETGSASDVLTALVGAALGRDARFDFMFPRGADFSREKAQHAELVASGGRLAPPKPPAS